MVNSKADLVLRRANAITLDPRHPIAGTVYIADGKILKVSGNDIEKQLIDARTEVIDCHYRTVIPAFHDAHCHIVAYAESLINIDISPAAVSSIEDIIAKITEAAAFTTTGKWIRCAGYNEFYLAEKRQPTRYDLDRATTLHPVKITHRSGHAHVLNSKALALAGISGETEEPPGTIIERDLDTGEPNGIVYGMGTYLARRIPGPDDIEMETAMGRAGRNLLALGIATLQDASPCNDMHRWNQFLHWKKKKVFQPRVIMMFGAEHSESIQGKQPFYDRETGLGSGAIKIMLDEVKGSLNPPQAELNRLVLDLHKRGFQIALHAVEENTVRAALTALEYAQRGFPDIKNRHRLEHCSICTPEMAERLYRIGAMVTTNPVFIYYSGERYLSTVPAEQLGYLYAVATMLKAGLNVAAGSDAPIAPPDPIKGIYAAVSREAQTGQKVAEHEAINILQALKLSTVNAAWSCFREKQTGSISKGKYADLAVLNADPLKLKTEELKYLKVNMTLLGGQMVHGEAI